MWLLIKIPVYAASKKVQSTDAQQNGYASSFSNEALSFVCFVSFGFVKDSRNEI